jgi:ADP-ribose pyrophosphatase YjhB (NUDIX family)
VPSLGKSRHFVLSCQEAEVRLVDSLKRPRISFVCSTIITMKPMDLFRFCPKCGLSRAVENRGITPLRCHGCNFVFYFNPTVAAAAFVFDDRGRALLIKRAKDPGANKYGVPGGFIDFGESAVEGLRREMREEVGIEIDRVRYLDSFTNLYLYKEVTYPVVDLYFTAITQDPSAARPLDAVSHVEWRNPNEVSEEEVAFPSTWQAFLAVRTEARSPSSEFTLPPLPRIS